MKIDRIIIDRLEESAKLNRLIVKNAGLISSVKETAELIINTYKNGGRLFIAGNGGSAADSQHIATEFVSRFYKERAALSAESLTANTSNLTAISNDYDFAVVFSRQLEASGMEGDIFWGISTSGNSKNIIKALEKAKEMKIKTIGFTGQNSGKMADLCNVLISIPSKNTPRIQEYHITIAHIICELVESTLFPNK